VIQETILPVVSGICVLNIGNSKRCVVPFVCSSVYEETLVSILIEVSSQRCTLLRHKHHVEMVGYNWILLQKSEINLQGLALSSV
jgi:hypothetical protein